MKGSINAYFLVYIKHPNLLLSKLKLTDRTTNQCLRGLSYIGPSLWSGEGNSLKRSASLNAFKHYIQD